MSQAPVDTSTLPDTPPVTRLRGLVAAVRPRQWVKNVLVAAAPVAAGTVLDPEVALPVVGAFAVFCLAASGIYLVNDTLDVAADRAHPRKRHRPIAAGVVSPRAALALAALLLAGAVALGSAVAAGLGAVVATYVVVQLAYCRWLKHQPVLDIGVVASGFVLRSVAGGVAAGVPISQWFLLVAGFGSLFMAAGKRSAELATAERTGAGIRPALRAYTPGYLRFVWMLSATLLIATYALWTVEIRDTTAQGGLAVGLSIVPFVLAVLRYAVDVDGGRAGAPEDVALGDRVLQALGLVWLAALCCGIFV